jgi:hypothetical protein
MKEPRQNVTFEQLIAKVKRAEDVLEARERGVSSSYQHLRQVWREGWTPLRIISAGLVAGFVSGRAEPLRALSSARMLQMVSAVSGLFATAQATVAAQQAGDAADSAEQVAAEAGVATDNASKTVVEPDLIAPRPAEAATELSEH